MPTQKSNRQHKIKRGILFLIVFSWLSSLAWAANPVAGTAMPSSGSSSIEESISFTTTYSDSDGWRDIKYIYLLINTTSAEKTNCFYGRYEPATNNLYLKDDADNAWLGGFTAGSSNLIDNSYARLDCSKVIAIPRSSNNSITVRWPIKFKNAFAGTKKIYLLASDKSDNESGWKEAGIWVILRSDTTPPDLPRVIDDGAFTTSTTQLHARWSASDPESEVLEYQYQIFEGTKTGKAILADWISTGIAPEALKTGLSLSVGQTYYFGVKAKNGAGLWSGIGYSDGIKIIFPDDTTPPKGSIQINGGKTYTSSPDVVLNLTVDDNEAEGGSPPAKIKMKFSNNGPESDWTPEEDFKASKNWKLSNLLGEGIKEVYVKFKDEAGNWSGPIRARVVLDTVKPTTPVVDDGGIAHSVTELTATWTPSASLSLIKEYQYAIIELPLTTFIPVLIVEWTSIGNATQATVKGLSLVTGKTYYFAVRAKSNAGLWSDTGYSKGVTVDVPDNIAPTGAIQINGGAQYTNSLDVILNLKAQDNPGGAGLDKMKFSYTGLESEWSPEEDFNNTRGWSFPIGDGMKTVYVQFRDRALNWSKTYAANIFLDTIPPTGSVKIKEKPYARARDVSLNFRGADNAGGSGLAQIQIINEDFSGLDEPEPYSDTRNWRLSSADGEKSVYAIVIDKAGNHSEIYWDTTYLETSLPTTAISGIGKEWKDTPVTITLTATDKNSGIDKTYYSLDGSTPTNIYTGPFTISKEGIYAIKYYSTDKAGNTEAVQVGPDPVRIDTSVPTGSIRIKGDAIYTNTLLVTLTLRASDTVSGVSEMQLSNDGAIWLEPEPYVLTKQWTLAMNPSEKPPLNVRKTVYVKFKDAAGHWSITYADNINLNIPAPKISDIEPLDGATFYEKEAILIRPSISDAHLAPSPIDYKFSVDGEVKQDWSKKESYIWTAGATGIHHIKIETRDTVGEDSKQLEIYVFRRGVLPSN